jgi:hypothetical protein
MASAPSLDKHIQESCSERGVISTKNKLEQALKNATTTTNNSTGGMLSRGRG